MAVVNYAEQYGKALAQAYPYVLYFGDLWSTENKERYKVVDAKTVKIPVIKTSGRVDGDRDTITGFQRRHDNDWETKTLENHRTWDTLVHPMDVNQTNMVMSIQNATKVFNETQKFPEMDAYTISKIRELKVAQDAGSDNTTALTVDNVLSVIDKAMEDMDNARVPQKGRILYCTPTVNTLIKNAKEMSRMINVGDNTGVIKREVSRIDELNIKVVPQDLMKTVYDFTDGWEPGTTAKQINLFIVHPSSILPIVSYSFAGMEAPSAHSKGKWLYFEESFEDIFILNQRTKAIFFNVEA